MLEEFVLQEQIFEKISSKLKANAFKSSTNKPRFKWKTKCWISEQIKEDYVWAKTERERMTDGEKEILTYVAGTSINSLSASLLDTQTHSQSNPRFRVAVLHTADLLLKESSRENTAFSVGVLLES